MLLIACGQSKPASPDPQKVLGILRQYPSGTLVEDHILDQTYDTSYRLAFAVKTTPEEAIRYYTPLLQNLGMEENPSRGPTSDNLHVDYRWYYYGCPFHSVTITTSAQKLQLTYVTGDCR
jgi:hypothetical protein